MNSVTAKAFFEELAKIAGNIAISTKPTAIPAPTKVPSMAKGLPAVTDYTTVNTKIPTINTQEAGSKMAPPPPVRT